MKAPRLLFLDVDDTLYSRDCGLWFAILDRIQHYIETNLEITAKAAATMRERFLSQYGTTLRGLQAEFSVDAKDYLEYVHDVHVGSYIKPNPALRSMLEALTIPTYYFTNAYRKHVERVLSALGIADLPIEIIDIVALDYQNKPLPAAYDRALSLAGNPDPSAVILVDDRSANLIPAAGRDMFTVLVGPKSNGFQPDARIDQISQLTDCIPGAFRKMGMT